LPQKAAELSAPRRTQSRRCARWPGLGEARGALRLALGASSGRMPAGYTVGAALGFLTVLYSNGVRQRAHAYVVGCAQLACMQGVLSSMLASAS